MILTGEDQSVLRETCPIATFPTIVKVNFTLERPRKPRGGVEVYLYSFFNPGAR